jgi:transposase
MSKKIRTYTQEFKEESVKLALKSVSVSRTAKELGVPVATLHNWVKELKQLPASGLSQGQTISTLLEENRRLHKELSRSKEEKEILKKAAAYFARESS